MVMDYGYVAREFVFVSNFLPETILIHIIHTMSEISYKNFNLLRTFSFGIISIIEQITSSMKLKLPYIVSCVVPHNMQ